MTLLFKVTVCYYLSVTLKSAQELAATDYHTHALIRDDLNSSVIAELTMLKIYKYAL